MPKSRGRKPGRRHQSHPRATSARDRELLGLAGLLRDVGAAEARGDASGALDLIQRDLESRGDLSFWAPWRVERLALIEALGPLLPGWAVSRWLLAQAAQHLGHPVDAAPLRALELAVTSRGGLDTVVGVDEMDRRSKVMDRDWCYRQLVLYELGQAEQFVRRVAAPGLVRRADHVHDWLRTSMGAYRLVSMEPPLLVWGDLAAGEEVCSLDIGSATLVDVGECAIGRLVPIDGGSMFESAPLRVPDELAAAVAADPAGWLEALSGRPDVRRDVEPMSVLSDVPPVLQMLVARACTPGVDDGPPTVDDVVQVRAHLVRVAIEGRLCEDETGLAPYPTVAAALHDPLILEDVALGLTPAQVPGLLALAELLPAPSDELCRRLARDVDRVA